MHWSADLAPQWVNCSLAELAAALGDSSRSVFVCAKITKARVCVCVPLRSGRSAYHISLCLADSALIIAPRQGSPSLTGHTNLHSLTHRCYWSWSIECQVQTNTTSQTHGVQMSRSSGFTSEDLLLSSGSNECLVCSHTQTACLLSKLLWSALKAACRDLPASLISPSVSWALKPARFSSMVLVQQVGPWGHILRCSPWKIRDAVFTHMD